MKATPEKAFKFFTENLGKWWPTDFSVGSSPMQDAIMEVGAGGRWYDVGQDGNTCQWGEVLAWNPPNGLVLAWRITAGWQFDPDLLTEVDVSFTDMDNGETEVTLEHRKLETTVMQRPKSWVSSRRLAAGMLRSHALLKT